MSNLKLVPEEISERYEVHEWRNALPILIMSHPQEWIDICECLKSFNLYRSEILKKGGNKSPIARRLDSYLLGKGWVEKQFDTKISVDGNTFDAPTHKVDCVKGRVALEVEWSNKDPFYDRDLNNFRLLFDLKAIDVGVIITRCSELQEIFDDLGKGSSYGQSTTHMNKLVPRIDGGGGGGCPILVFGISKRSYVED